MNNKILIAAILLASAGLNGTASAATITTNLVKTGGSFTLSDVSVVGNVDLNNEDLTTETMSDHKVSGVNFTLVNASIVQGSAPGGEYTKPLALADTDHYIAMRGGDIDEGLPSGFSFYSLNLSTTTFGFDWGSIDTYNSLRYTNGDGKTTAILGSQILTLLAANPEAGYQGDVYFTLTDLAGIRSLVLSSTEDSMEVGNFMVASIPLPAALPIFGAGLVGLAALRRRKAKMA